MGKMEISIYCMCDKHTPMKSLRLKKSNLWMTHDIIKLLYERDHVPARLHKTMIQNYGKITVTSLRNKVTCIIKERKNVYFNDIHALCRNDPKNMFGNKTTRTCILLVTFWGMISITILPILATK